MGNNNIMTLSMISAFTGLAHNGKLIRQAESILQEAVKNDNTYIYIKNPDGTRVRLQKGFEIEDYEYVPVIIKR